MLSLGKTPVASDILVPKTLSIAPLLKFCTGDKDNEVNEHYDELFTQVLLSDVSPLMSEDDFQAIILFHLIVEMIG